MPINRKIGVNLAFTADTKQAQAQLNNLQNTLTQLVNTAPAQGFSGFTKELQQASTAAATLKVQLSDATNVNTGKLDLGKFNQSLKTSGMTLEMYKNQLTNLGPQGVAAFGQLSQAIMNAEMPLRRSSQLLTDFATTLKNTARWQISSSILHGFMGSVQSAYYYAQDLNESLNNIRIVTGKSVDEMSDFAKEANSAAQALSTTTTAYTDASLIYYQQGLSDEEVKERTDVTIKMANVARESATEVSEQMTAIWNNFAKGGDNLEYYSDVITALGAATASSSAEISEGLEKFAAVADTVGLSYEYATSALATVTATTRQSADIVGNAFKTLFSRIQGLKLGETLDDGTDLNKYSAALEAVGVNIKGVDGELKDMDVILDELGNKWQTLGKDQKMALAQTVAGVRQYTQLIALMDNWDFFQENLNTARNSEGTLQKQANIYAESWEAAQKRVKASMEDLYNTLLDDKFFIKITDGLSKTINLVTDLTKGLGGMKGILTILSTLLLKIFNKDLANNINNVIYGIQMSTKAGRQEVQNRKQEANEQLQSLFSNSNNPYDKAIGEAYASQGRLQNELIDKADLLNEKQKEIAALLIDQQKTLIQNVKYYAEEAKEAERITNIQIAHLKYEGTPGYQLEGRKAVSNYANTIKERSYVGTYLDKNIGSFSTDIFDANLKDVQSEYQLLQKTIEDIIRHFNLLGETSSQIGNKLKNTLGEDMSSALGNLYGSLKGIDFSNLEVAEEQLKPVKNTIQTLVDQLFAFANAEESAAEIAAEKVTEGFLSENQSLDEIAKSAKRAGESLAMMDDSSRRAAKGTEETSQNFIKLLNITDTTGESIAQLTQIVSSSVMQGSMLANSWKMMSTEGNNLSSVMMSFGSAVGSVTRSIQAVTVATTAFQAALGWLGIVLTAITAAISIYSDELEKNKQKKIELSEEATELANKTHDEIVANEDLYNSYKNLYDSYNNGLNSKEDLYDITDQITEAYELERATIAKLTGDYDKLTEAIENKRKVSLEEARSANNDAKKKAEERGFTDASSNLLEKVQRGTEYKEGIYKTRTFGNKYDKQLEELASQYENITVSSKGMGAGVSIEASNIFDYYNFLKENIKKIESEPKTRASETQLDFLNNELKDIEQGYLDAKQAMENNLDIVLSQAGISQDIGKATSDNIESIYNNIIKEVENAKNNGEILPDTDVKSAVDDYIYNLNNEVANQFLKIKSVRNMGLSGEALDYFKGLTDEQQNLVIKSGIIIDEETSKTQIENAINTIENNIGSISIPLDMSTSINEAVLKGKDINKNDWESLLSTIPDSAKNILGDRDEFNNKGIAERLNLLNQVNELIIENSNLVIQNTEKQRETNKLRNEEIEKELIKLKEERETLINNKSLFNNNQTIEIFDNTLKEIDDKINRFLAEQRTLEITPEVSLDAANDALNATAEVMLNDLNKMKAGVELIGENWTVAADDVRQFAAYFPELAAQAKHLENGSLEFTEIMHEAVATTLNGNIQIMNSNKEVIVQAIDDKLIQLRAENEFQKKKIAILKEVLKGTKSEADAEIEIAGAAREYKDTLEEHGVQVDSEAWDAAMKNAEVGTGNIISQLEAVNQAIGVVHDNFAKMLTKDGLSSFDVSGVSAGMTGNNDWSADVDESEYAKNLAESTIKVLTSEIEAAQQVVESNNEQIASLEGTRAEILKTLKDSSDAVDRVNKGLAGKESKDKKSSGSSKKEKERDKEQKKLEDEFDRYWELKKAIDAVDKAISKLEKDQQNLYGYELINSLKEENKLLEQQKGHYEALAEAQRQEAAELQGVLAGYGVAFDASGAITNYAAATSAALAQYNDAIAQYNAGLIEESALKVYEKNYEAFKKALERYDTLFYNEMKDTQDKLDDLWRKELANNLKAWEVEVKLKLDMKELKRGWNDFLKEIKEDFKKVYKDLNVDLKNLKKNAKTYVGDDGTITTIINAVHDVTAEIDKLRSGGSSDMFESISQAQEKLKELNDQLQQAGRELNNLRKEAYELYLSELDQIEDMFDMIQKDFDQVEKQMSFIKQSYELIYGSHNFEKLDEYYAAQDKINNDQIEAARAQYEFYVKAVEQSGQMSRDISTWTQDEVKNYNDMLDAQSALYDKTLEGFQLAAEIASYQKDKINYQLEMSLTNNRGIEGIRSSWEKAKEQAELYLDDVEKITEAQKLANQVEGVLNSTTDAKSQAKLQKFLNEEIKALREKEKVSKYEVQAAQERLDIIQKEITLREAQENKTSMKLTRNEQGNWTYQYIADEDDVNSKQQDLLDALSKFRENAIEAENELEELAQTALERYIEGMSQLEELRLNHEIEEEEYQRRKTELEEEYFNTMTYVIEQSEIARQNAALGTAALMNELYQQDPINYEVMTEAEKALLDDLKLQGITDFQDLEDAFADNSTGIKDKSDTLMGQLDTSWNNEATKIIKEWAADNGVSVRSKISKAMEEIEKIYNGMDRRINDKIEKSGINFEEEMGKAIIKTDDLKKTMDNLIDTEEPKLENMRKLIEDIEAAWDKVEGPIRRAIDTIEEYLQYVGETKNAMDELTMSAANAANAIAAAKAAEAAGGSGGGTTGGNPENNKEPYEAYNMYRDGTVTIIDEHGEYVRTLTDDERKKKFGYATGGYTGEWNNGSTDGRLAFLHQKELILNEDDTSNFLEGINTIRDMSSLNGSISKAIVSSVANMVLALSKHDINVPAGASSESVSAGDVFNITAEFPNANDVNEIRQAILSLPNLASQYMAQNGR